MKKYDFTHTNLTDEESYNNCKKLYEENPNVFMSPREWKRLQLIELNKQGKNWGK